MIPGSGRSPGRGKGNPLQYSCLEKPTDRGAWRAAVHGVGESDTRLKQLGARAHTLTHTHTRVRTHTHTQLPRGMFPAFHGTGCSSRAAPTPAPPPLSRLHSAGRPPFPHPSCRPSWERLPHPQGQALPGARSPLDLSYLCLCSNCHSYSLVYICQLDPRHCLGFTCLSISRANNSL